MRVLERTGLIPMFKQSNTVLDVFLETRDLVHGVVFGGIMKKVIWVLGFLLALSSLAFAGGGDALSGRFVVKFEPASSAWAKTYREKMIKENIIPTVLQAVAEEVRLPKDIPVTFKDCGFANAFWNRVTNEMVMCYEMIEVMHDAFPEQANRNSLIRAVGHNVTLKGTILFIMFHELGHGFVNIFDIPITGREEDAVDQFSAILLLDTDPEGMTEIGTGLGMYALFGAELFNSFAAEPTELSKSFFADEHSLGQQRYYDLLCLVVGSNYNVYGPLIASGVLAALPEIVAQPDITPEQAQEIVAKYDDQNVLPAARAVNCEAEYAKIKRSWDVLLEAVVPQR
jgi:Putative metallopeptidase